MRNGWGNRQWHTVTLFYWRAEQAHARSSGKSHSTQTHTRTHHPGYPSCSFPPDAEAIGTISCPLSPSLRTAPSFLDKLHILEQPGLRTSVSTAPLYNNLPHLNRQGLIAQCTHTHPDKDKEAHCDTQAPDRNTLKAAWSFKWPSGYSTLLHFTSISFKAVSAKCLGRVRAYRLAGSRFTLGESNRLKNHKVL